MLSISNLLNIGIILLIIILPRIVHNIRKSLWIKIGVIIGIIIINYILYKYSIIKVFPKIFEFGILILHIILLIIDYLIPTKSRNTYEKYQGTMTYFGVTLLAIISLLIKIPFTIGSMKETVPQNKWNTQQFYNINKKITKIWVIVFTMMGISATIPEIIVIKNPIIFKTIIPLILFLLAKYYPKIII